MLLGFLLLPLVVLALGAGALLGLDFVRSLVAGGFPYALGLGLILLCLQVASAEWRHRRAKRAADVS